MSLWWVYSLLIIERLLELAIAAGNRKFLLARGGREYHAESYRVIVALHLLFFIALFVESYPWRIPLDALSWTCLVMIVMLQGLRYWCILSLGRHWNTRIILVPGISIPPRGPYRIMRHPNYLVVTLEFLFIPLLSRAPFTLLCFSILNLLILRQRIGLEEKALREQTDYNRHYPDRKPSRR